MVSIITIFSILTIVLMLLHEVEVINAKTLNINFLLWSSYIIIIIITVLISILTRQTRITWTKPIAESDILEKGKYSLEKGKIFLIFEQKNEKAFDVFNDAITHNVQGLCLTRENPKIIKEKYQLEKTKIIWLTELKVDNAIDPTDIEEISYSINKFIKSASNGIILFEGLEYLINFSPFLKIMHMLQDLRDKILMKNIVLIIPISKDVLTKDKIKLLERELEVFI